jgi:hypothetical protein
MSRKQGAVEEAEVTPVESGRGSSIFPQRNIQLAN